MKEKVKWIAEVDYTLDKDGDSKRKVLNLWYEKTGKLPETLANEPVVDKHFEPVLDCYWDIASFKTALTDGLTLQDFVNYQHLFGTKMRKMEMRIIKMLDTVFINTVQKGLK